MFNNKGYRWLGNQYVYNERLSLTNGDSTNHLIHDGNYERQEYSYKHPYGLYGYATKMVSYNQGWSNNYPKNDSYSPFYYSKSNIEMMSMLKIHPLLHELECWRRACVRSKLIYPPCAIRWRKY